MRLLAPLQLTRLLALIFGFFCLSATLPAALGQAAGSIGFEFVSYTVNEQAAYHTVRLLRTGGSSGAVSVNYATTDGTASSASDYVTSSGTLAFDNGETEKVISVQISSENPVVSENAETFSLTLTGPQVGVTATTVFTINDTPVVGTIAAQTTAIATPTSAIAFTIADPETAAENLSVTATTTNPVLLPPSGIILVGSGTNRTITLTPAAALSGSAPVTILVTDAGGAVAVRTFTFSVGPATSGTAVAIPAAVPATVVLTADESFTLNYTVTNSAWVTSVSRSNTTLFNAPGTGSSSDLRTQPASGGTARTLRIRPGDRSTRAGFYGLSTVTLGFTGVDAPAAQTFDVRVNPRAVADNNLLGIPGTTSTFDVLANDVVPIAGHTFTITSVSAPANGTLAIAPGGKLLRYTPTNLAATFDTFTYTVTVSSDDSLDGYQFTGIGYVKIGGYIVLDSTTSSQHIDLDFDYINGKWSQIIRTDAAVGGSVQSGNLSPTVLDADEGILFFDPSTKQARGAAPSFDVLGVPAGADVWYGPTTGSGDKLFLGIANESTSGIEAYTPVGDSRATSDTTWVATKLVGFTGPGHFTAFDGSDVAFDTFDGLNSPTDSTSGGNVTDTFWGLVGSHAHPAWYFTAPGTYALTFQTTVKANGVFVTSPPTTFYFAVDTISGNAHLKENPPLAHADALTAVENGGPVTLNVTANDSSEADGFEELLLTAVGNATYGTTALAGDGKSVIYTPNPEFNGSDSFTYNVTDEHGGQATAMVTVTVSGENDLPGFSGMSVSTFEDTPVNILFAKILAKSSDPEGNPITITGVNSITAQGGTATLGANAITYNPANGFTGADTVTFTLGDGIGTINHTISVSVSQDPLFTSSSNGPIITALEGGGKRIVFHGIPGRTYAIQRSTTMAPGSWTQIVAVAAAANSIVTFDDPMPPQPSAFYRIAYPAE